MGQTDTNAMKILAFAGAFLAAKIAANHKMKFALAIGCIFLAGGIINVILLPSPVWFTMTDLWLTFQWLI